MRQDSDKWYGTVNGKRVPLCGDKQASKRTLSKLLNDAAEAAVGLADPFAALKRTPLADHLTAYQEHLTAKGNTADHCKQTGGRIAAMFAGCGFVLPTDVDAGRASEWLNAMRTGTPAVVVPPGDSFTPAQVAALFGVSGAAVRATVKRLGVTVTGHGSARRYPRATVVAMADRTGQGFGPETVNHYVRAVRGFVRWMVKAKRTGANPLDTLTLVNARSDVRRGRRELMADELRRLLVATRKSGRTFRGLTGEDRFHLYLTAATTGFRATALASLTLADFDLSDVQPTVTLPARFNKSRVVKVQPLPGETVARLRAYLPTKPTGRPVWGGTWAADDRGAEMLRGDLEAAGIAYAVPGPDGLEYADFHALRHTFLTMLGQHGVDLRTAQVLAGHSKPELTARYSHRRMHDLTGAVAKLPTFTTDAGENEKQSAELMATGSDDGSAWLPVGCPN